MTYRQLQKAHHRRKASDFSKTWAAIDRSTILINLLCFFQNSSTNDHLFLSSYSPNFTAGCYYLPFYAKAIHLLLFRCPIESVVVRWRTMDWRAEGSHLRIPYRLLEKQ